MIDPGDATPPPDSEVICRDCGTTHAASGVCPRCALAFILAADSAATAGDAPRDTSAGPPPASPDFEHYRIELRADGTAVELGRGGMGVTYLAIDRRLRIPVALKVISPDRTSDPEAQDLFLREARAAATVRHPNVASVLFLNDSPTRLFFAMEFVAGEPLHHWIRVHGALPVRVALDVAEQTARGLAAIHAEGIIHRDLKPGNVMLVPNRASGTTLAGVIAADSEWQVKIIDFGLARHILRADDLAQTIGFRGTVLYASPEQCEERRDLDGRSDLYSLGCILWEMLSGRPPFRGPAKRDVLNQHVTERLPFAELAHVPRAVVSLVSRLLQKDRQKRFPDATALAVALARLRTELPADTSHWKKVPANATPPTAPESARLWQRLLVVAVCVLLLGGGGYYLLSSRTPGGALPARLEPTGVAVLPFATNGLPPEDIWLAQGLHSELLDTLSRVPNLKVISRDSLAEEKPGTGSDARALAAKFGVAKIVEGSVRKEGSRVLVNLRIVSPRSGEILAAPGFDRAANEIAGLPSEMAIALADALNPGTPRTPDSPLTNPPTRDAAAYTHLLRARALIANPVEARRDLDEAAKQLEQAITLDPNYAAAHAQLSSLHSYFYLWGRDRTDQRLELALQSAEAAGRLAPDAPETQMAFGHFYYRGRRDYERALPYYRRALAAAPGNADALAYIGYIERRQGKWGGAAEKLERASEANPLDPILFYNVANTRLCMHEYERAWQILQAALAHHPTHVALMKLKGDLFLVWKGDLSEMRKDIETRSPHAPYAEAYVFDKVELFLFERRFDDALSVLNEGKFGLIDGQARYITRDMLEAEILTQARRAPEARAAWARALPRLAEAAAARPTDPRIRLAHALALAGTGEAARALAEAQAGVQLAPPEKDAQDAPWFLYAQACVQLRAGQPDAAAQTVRRLEEMPSPFSAHTFRLSPAFAALRP